MNDTNLNTIVMHLFESISIAEIQSLDLRVLRRIEIKADKDLLNAGVQLDWIRGLIAGEVSSEDLRELEKQADLEVINAGNRYQWIRNIINKKISEEGLPSGTSE